MILVAIYFVLGGIATAIVNRRKPEAAKQRWIKYFVYVLIVYGMLAVIQFGFFLLTAVIITLIGLYEIFRIGRGKTMWIAIGLYFLIASLFILFARDSDSLILYMIVFIFDGFCQVCGQLFGKTKLVANISPAKTIEGLVGGFLITVATAYFTWNNPITASIICAAALAGDLLASYYKRKCGVKDYSKLIPAHGGVLDRFDSLIFAGAVCNLIF
jgi:phosphatidate cytidylyltransferase